MKKRYALLISVFAAAMALSFDVPARGQVLMAGQTALQNASSGAVRNRAPGNMVTAGLARAQAAADVFQARPQITETSQRIPIRSQFLVEAVGIIFDQINQTLALLGNLLLARAGLPALIPTDILSPITGTDGDSDSTDPDSTGRDDDRRPPRTGRR